MRFMLTPPRPSSTFTFFFASAGRLAQIRFPQAAIDGNHVAGGLCALIASQPNDGTGTVLRKNRTLRQRALRVELSQLRAQLFRGLRLGERDLVFLQRLHHAVGETWWNPQPRWPERS